ncbi:MAG: fluoride efflux transporter CrcB [Gemmatimonadota bacterium]
MLILMIALGGAVGAVARYGLSGWVQGQVGTTFPIGTLAVNVLGSFVLGLSLPLFESLAWSAETRTMLTMGFLGAFTTYSTFSYEAVVLLEGGEWTRGGIYMGGSLFLGLAGVVAGMAAASFFLQTRG